MGYGEAPEHDVNHGKLHEGGGATGMSFVARDRRRLRLVQANVRSTIQRLASTTWVRLNHHGRPCARRMKSAAAPAKSRLSDVAVLDFGGMHADVRQQALCVNEDVALVPRTFFPASYPDGSSDCPPKSALLAPCALRIAVVGLASRPQRLQFSTKSAS